MLHTVLLQSITNTLQGIQDSENQQKSDMFSGTFHCHFFCTCTCHNNDLSQFHSVVATLF